MIEPQPKFVINRRDTLSPQQRAAREQYEEEDIPTELRIPEAPLDPEGFVEQFGYVEFDPRYQLLREQAAIEILQLPITEFTDPAMAVVHERFARLFPDGATVGADGYVQAADGARYLPSALLPSDHFIDERAQRQFITQYERDGARYHWAEQARVYEDPLNDPVVKSFISSLVFDAEREVEYRRTHGRPDDFRLRADLLRNAMQEKIREWTSGKLEKAAGYAAMTSENPDLQMFLDAIRIDLTERSEFNGEQRFVKTAPRAIDMYGDASRTNAIHSQYRPETPSIYHRVEIQERDFTEADGLQDLITFLDQVEVKAQAVGETEIAETAGAMRENIAFIGDREFTEATDAIAGHMINLVKNGKRVYVDVVKLRSERYTSLRILESFHKLTEAEPELRDQVKLGRAYDIAEECSADIANSHILVPDDFGVSGNRICGATYNMQDMLRKKGISANDALRSIEATLIAMPNEVVQGRLKVRDQLFSLFAYYGVPEYRKPDGGSYVFTGVSMSGAHCSVDYGFEVDLDRFTRFMREQGETVTTPLLTHIRRPYESKATTAEHFADTALQDRWNTIVDKYGLNAYQQRKTETDAYIASQEAEAA